MVSDEHVAIIHISQVSGSEQEKEYGSVKAIISDCCARPPDFALNSSSALFESYEPEKRSVSVLYGHVLILPCRSHIVYYVSGLFSLFASYSSDLPKIELAPLKVLKKDQQLIVIMED